MWTLLKNFQANDHIERRFASRVVSPQDAPWTSVRARVDIPLVEESKTAPAPAPGSGIGAGEGADGDTSMETTSKSKKKSRKKRRKEKKKAKGL